MKQFRFFSLFILLGSFLTSCDVDVDLSEEEEILMGHTWRRFSYTVNGTESIQECMKDDTYQLFEDGTAEIKRYTVDNRRIGEVTFTSYAALEAAYNTLLAQMADNGVPEEELYINIYDTLTFAPNDFRATVDLPVVVCSEDFTGYDVDVIRWHFDGNENSITFQHDFSLKDFSTYIPEMTELLQIESPANKILPVDYDITFIKEKEFHVRQRKIITNPDGTLNEEIFVTKFKRDEPKPDPIIVLR